MVIMGAGGRDFHVFNCCYRHDDRYQVIAFTATQIPHIDQRTYPPVLAGPLYPSGIPIRPESELEQIVSKQRVDEVVFAYSDVSFAYVDDMRRRVEAMGASLRPFDPEATMLTPSKPCIAVCAVRTGCGKSAVSRHVTAELRALETRPAVIRHPMPYGALEQQIVQRFASLDDLATHDCTIEEREEFEPHILAGNTVFAGADYGRVLAAAEAESDVIVWDGGNNDTPFIRPSLLITVLDPLRAGDEVSYFPGLWNLDNADVLVISKIDEARIDQLAILHANIRERNPDATVIEANLSIDVDEPALVKGRRVLVIEDGPTVTHGGMPYGAGYLAARRVGAAEIVDPRPFAVGQIARTLEEYGHIGPVLPALGYAASQLEDLKNTIERADCDAVIVATPIDLGRVIELPGRTVRVSYRFEERPPARLPKLLAAALDAAMG